MRKSQKNGQFAENVQQVKYTLQARIDHIVYELSTGEYLAGDEKHLENVLVALVACKHLGLFGLFIQQYIA